MTKKDHAEKTESKSAKGKDGKGKGGVHPERSLDELILNYDQGKYAAIPLISEWAKILRKREENRHLTPVELLDLAMKDVLSGATDWGMVDKALANGAAEDGAAAEKNGKAEKAEK